MKIRRAASLVLLSSLLLASCSSIQLSTRNAKDLSLTTSKQLSGQFLKIDTLYNGEIVEQRLSIQPLDEKTLDFQLYKNDTLVINEQLRGRLKHGYFKARRKWDVHLITGPLMWILANDRRYIRLTAENNVAVLKSSAATLFLMPLPVMVGGDQGEYEYVRIE